MAKLMASISLRMTEKGAESLKEVAAKHRDLSQGAIVEKLIEYLVSADEPLKSRILKGERVDFFQLLGDAFHLAEWGDHAFRKGWVTWSIETYAELDKRASGVEGIQQIARFRLGSSWMDFAMEIRERALLSATGHPEWNEHYKCAIEGLLVSIGYHRLFNETVKKKGAAKSSEQQQRSEDTSEEVAAHPVILYNEACGWSLIGKYVSERNAGPNSSLAKEARAILAKTKRSEPQERISEKTKKVDLQIAHDSAIQLAIKQSKECLNRIRAHPGNALQHLPIEETYWLFDLAKRDPDLDFLRTMEAKYFEKVLETQEREVSIGALYTRLRLRVPNEVSALIPKLPDGR